MSKFVIKSDNGGDAFFIADWPGDPGRTTILNNAKVFDSRESAERKMRRLIKRNSHRDLSTLKVINVQISENF